MTIACLMQHSERQRAIAQMLVCSADTVSRELERNTQGKTNDRQSAQPTCQHCPVAYRSRPEMHTEFILNGFGHTPQQVSRHTWPDPRHAKHPHVLT